MKRSLTEKELENICNQINVKTPYFVLSKDSPVVSFDRNLVIKCRDEKGDIWMGKAPSLKESVYSQSSLKEKNALLLLGYEPFVPKVNSNYYDIILSQNKSKNGNVPMVFQLGIQGETLEKINASLNCGAIEARENYFVSKENSFRMSYLYVIQQLFYNAAILEKKYGVIHGDLSSSNIILDKAKEHISFIDFESYLPVGPIIGWNEPVSSLNITYEMLYADKGIVIDKIDSYALSVCCAAILLDVDNLLPEKVKKTRGVERTEAICQHIKKKKNLFSPLKNHVVGVTKEYLGSYMDDIDVMVQLGIEPKYEKRWGSADLYGKAAAMYIDCCWDDKNYDQIVKQVNQVQILGLHIEKRAVYNSIQGVLMKIFALDGYGSENKQKIIQEIIKNTAFTRQVICNVEVSERHKFVYGLKNYVKKYLPQLQQYVDKNILY